MSLFMVLASILGLIGPLKYVQDVFGIFTGWGSASTPEILFMGCFAAAAPTAVIYGWMSAENPSKFFLMVCIGAICSVFLAVWSPAGV